MSLEIVLINIFSAVLGALILVYYYKSIMGYNIATKIWVTFVVIFGILNGIISTQMTIYAIKPLVLIVLSILLIMIFLRIAFLQAFLSFSLYTISLAIGNALIPLFANLFTSNYTIGTMQDNPLILLVGNLFVNVIALILFIMIKPLKLYIKAVNRDKFIIILTIATFIVICSSFALHFNMAAFNITAYFIIASITISYCLFIIIMWFHSLKKAISDEDLVQQKFYNESLRSTLFDLRRFKHDWGNNLTVINSMLKMNKINELKQYVSELIAQGTEHSGTEIYNLKNAGLFGIISSKINQARELGVNVELSVIGEVEDIPGVKISELCEVVGIFLDNAIEEANKGPKSITVNIQNNDDHITISVSNSCVDAPDIHTIYKDGYSTKGANRGMGLAIAKKILGRYNNILHTTTYEDNIFTQTLEIALRKGF